MVTRRPIFESKLFRLLSIQSNCLSHPSFTLGIRNYPLYPAYPLRDVDRAFYLMRGREAVDGDADMWDPDSTDFSIISLWPCATIYHSPHTAPRTHAMRAPLSLSMERLVSNTRSIVDFCFPFARR